MPFKAAFLNEAQQAFNMAMSSVREAVEWGFVKVTTYWAFIDFSANQRLELQPVMAYYKLAILLANVHTCVYGSQTSGALVLDPPTLEEYFGFPQP